jgi:hypothetical protein
MRQIHRGVLILAFCWYHVRRDFITVGKGLLPHQPELGLRKTRETSAGTALRLRTCIETINVRGS